MSFWDKVDEQLVYNETEDLLRRDATVLVGKLTEVMLWQKYRTKENVEALKFVFNDVISSIEGLIEKEI